MMPSRTIIVGSLLISLLVHASPAAAITVDDIVAIPPVSQHYVQRTIDRANAGVAYASTFGASGGALVDIFMPWWIIYATSAMMSVGDTDLQVTAHQKDLIEATPCLHIDVLILQSKMEKVRQELHQALSAKQPMRIILLQSIIRFLNRRIEHLLNGARDPLYEDWDWALPMWFDPPNPVWCCPQGIPGNTCEYTDEQICSGSGGSAFITPRGCQEYGCVLPPSQDPLEGKLCPFHTNYLPPVISGYGCDQAALPAGASAHPPTVDEQAALAELMMKRDDFIMRMLAFQSVAQEIDTLAGATADYSALGSGLSRTHKELHGCIEQMPITQQIVGQSLLQRIHAGSFEIRGPFAIPKDEPWVILRLSKVVREWGRRRPLARDQRYASEFPPGADRTAAETRELQKASIQRHLDWFIRFFYITWNQYHAKEELQPIPKAQDAYLQLKEASPDMNAIITRMSRLVQTHSTGVRFFGKGFAYYLRRSCIYRPCNKRLDQVLRIFFQNSCFPYMTGTYYGNNQAHVDCKTDAGVTVSP